MGGVILGIETSCDETAAAVVRGGRDILSNVVLSQIGDHAMFGGVVPEVASRRHLEAVVPVVDEAVRKSGVPLGGVGAVAATYGPGLVGALLVGLSYAKGLARAMGVPFIGVHHVAAHILAASLSEDPPDPPFTALVVSGGHSSIYRVDNYRSFQLMGRTRDDAVGEAFDKVARATGLGYPGGQKLEAAAVGGDPAFIRFPRTVFRDGTYDFSFSGVKTAAINYMKKMPPGLQKWQEQQEQQQLQEQHKHPEQQKWLEQPGLPGLPCQPGQPIQLKQPDGQDRPNRLLKDFYASYQAALVDALAVNTFAAEAAANTGRIVVAGGVAANGALRRRFAEESALGGGKIRIFFPPPPLCTDNAAMVAARAYYDYAAGAFSPLTLNASPTVAL